MNRLNKGIFCAAAAAAILGGSLIAAEPYRVPVSAEACVVRAQETGACVIAGRRIAAPPAAARNDGQDVQIVAETVIRTAERHVEVIPKIGILPVDGAEIVGSAENAVTQTAAAPYTEEELEIFACAIYQEAGGDGCSDLCRMYVGDVMLNRVADPRFPDTLYEVLTQEHQYGLFWKTGIIWPGRASDPNEAAAVARAYDTARALLEGEHSELYGAGYIYQDTKPRGKDVIYLDGEYFGR